MSPDRDSPPGPTVPEGRSRVDHPDESRFRCLFEWSPVALFEVDLSELKKRLEPSPKNVGELRAALEADPDHLVELADTIRIASVNRAALELCQADDLEAIRHRFPDTPTGETCQALIDGAVALSRGSTGERHTTSIRTHRGETRYVEIRWTIPSGYEGTLERVLVSVFDLTGQRETEEALRKERNRAQKFLDVAEVMMLVLDREGRVTLINAKGCEILGHAEAEVIGKDWFDHFLPERIRREVREFFDALVAGRKDPVKFYENPVLTASGVERLMAWHNTLLTDGEGRVTATLSSGEDVTDRRRAENALRESEGRYRTLFENASDTIFLMQGLEFVDCNSNTFHLFGCTREQIIGTTPLDFSPLVQPDGEPSETKADRLALRAVEGLPQRFEWRHLRLDGTQFDAEISLNRVELAGETLMQALVRDITERKKDEARLQEYQVRLRSLANELSLTEEQERRRIATSLHDGACQSLVASKMQLRTLRAALNPEQHPLLDEVGDTVEGVIQNLRELSFDLSPPILHMLGLEAAIESLLEQELEAKHGIPFELDAGEASLPLGDEVGVLLYQSVRELILNVVKHARAQRVTVTVEERSGKALVTVRDDGIGFDVGEVTAHLSKTGGFGLFSIAERLMSIGGEFGIDSQPGRGSRFTLVAPLQTGLE